jgi:hypothetical protein
MCVSSSKHGSVRLYEKRMAGDVRKGKWVNVDLRGWIDLRIYIRMFAAHPRAMSKPLTSRRQQPSTRRARQSACECGKLREIGAAFRELPRASASVRRT